MTLIVLVLVRSLGGFLKLKKFYSNSSNRITRIVFKAIYKYFSIIHCSSIAINSKIGDGVIFPHSINCIFVSGEASIGDGCVIFQGVTIGSNTLIDSKSIGAPKIGNNCYIGAGAKIIGNVVIGDNVRIGANCVVVENVPPNCTIVGQPAKIIQSQKIYNNRFYTKQSGKWGYNSEGIWMEETDTHKLEILRKAFAHDN